jgi:hypothetical protein
MTVEYICSNCYWKSRLGMDFGSLEWLPPCPACNSIVEGFRILKGKQDAV